MILRMKPSNVIRLGLVSLVLGSLSLSRWFPVRGHLTESWMDAFSGFFYGAAITLLVFGMWMRGRSEKW